jgi:hypothetical protein
MAKDNIVIAARNHADEGSFSWYDGWWLDALPLSNLQDRRVGKVARTSGTDPSGTNFTVDLGKLRTIGLVAIIGHNLGPNAKWRVLVSRDGVNWANDSGDIPVWPRVERFGQLPWGVFLWGGVITQEVVEQGFTINSFYLPEPQLMGRYVRVYLIDGGNEDGFLQVGRLYVGPIYQPSVPPQYPLSISYVDRSRVSYSRGGQAYVDEGPRVRVLRFRLQFIPEAEAMGQIYDGLDRGRGIVGDMIVIPNPADERNLHRTGIYGRVTVLNENVMTFFDQFEREFVIEELI